ncbi:hypothetical protein ACFVAD_20390 [Sutcliffiella sp. NPDC057660]|uniref:hypothetical protein n=1 Tax=Sutcliffiella sp. NPDC057660 TaxID=3346199 RepID=UPI0036A31710
MSYTTREYTATITATLSQIRSMSTAHGAAYRTLNENLSGPVSQVLFNPVTSAAWGALVGRVLVGKAVPIASAGYFMAELVNYMNSTAKELHKNKILGGRRIIDDELIPFLENGKYTAVEAEFLFLEHNLGSGNSARFIQGPHTGGSPVPPGTYIVKRVQTSSGQWIIL